MIGALVMMSGMLMFGLVLLFIARRGDRYDAEQKRQNRHTV